MKLCGEVITIIYWLANTKIYVSDIEELYKDLIVGILVDSRTSDLIVHIVKYWRAFLVN